MLGIDPPATAATAEPPLPTTATTATPNNSVTPTRSEPHTNNSVLSDANGVPDLESTDGFNTSYDVTSNNQSISSDNDETSSQTSINEGPIYWTTFNSNLHDPNTGRPKVSPCQCSLHTSAIYNKRLYIFGGYDGSSRTNDFYEFCFEPVRMRGWRVIPPSIIPQGRDARDRDRLNPLNQHHQHQHHHHGDNSPDLHIPTPPNRQTCNNGQIPTPRDRHTAVVYGNGFYVFGGFDGTNRVNDFYCYDFNLRYWSCVEGRGGGRGGNDLELSLPPPPPTNTNNNGVTNGNAAEPVNAPPSPRHSHAAVVHGSNMYIFGGYDGSYRSGKIVLTFNAVDYC